MLPMAANINVEPKRSSADSFMRSRGAKINSAYIKKSKRLLINKAAITIINGIQGIIAPETKPVRRNFLIEVFA